MMFEVGKSYEVTESFLTPVLNGHEIGGVWSEHASVPLDPGNRFTVIGGEPTGWSIAEMNHNLWFASNENPGGSFSCKGKFSVRSDCHLKTVKEVK